MRDGDGIRVTFLSSVESRGAEEHLARRRKKGEDRGRGTKAAAAAADIPSRAICLFGTFAAASGVAPASSRASVTFPVNDPRR